jgi:hypothetical protein
MTLTPALSSLFTAATGWAATTRTGDRRSAAPLRAARGPRHPAPEDPLTITEAHRLMQQHLYCTVHGCATKAAAFELLVDVGHIAPDRSYFFGRS